tara:strand:- start:40123 stop:40605 length:483 start_codon:yes stop_codon:yes gene_type:complete
MTEEMIIDDSNFGEYFFDARTHGPKRDQILARFSAIAEFIDGKMKQDIIYLVSTMKNGGMSAVKVMQKLGCATYEAAIDVSIEVAEDLKAGLSRGMTQEAITEEVEKKAYSYHYEQFFYVKSECVPKDDPHWDIIQIANLNEHLDKVDGVGEIKSKIIES